jgi:hypothetical protein
MRTKLVLCLLAMLGHGSATETLNILGPNYPRVFFFRGCESWPSRPNVSFEDWSADFGRLSGIMGKCLDEEVLGREAHNPDWFSRFKREHPQQVVLLHFNGNARDPLHAPANYFPGHWIYRKATRITADVPAATGETEITVEDAGDFQVNAGRYRTSNDDIGLFGITADGKHDWSRCEQVQLVAVDKKTNTIRVKRGCYETQPLAFKAGQARAAAHQAEGPWGKTNHLLWFYNFTTHCPKDAAGKTCADRLVDDLAVWFGPGGKLAAFDGLEFDVMFNETHGDTDGDGEPDDGVVAGVNHYGIGMVEFARQLRQRLGPDRIIQGDGALGPGGRHSQRAFGVLNGIESEGWPNLNDWQFDDWSGGLNRHAFWQANAFAPAFSYINHKWVEHVPGKPGEQQFPEVPFARHRLVFAAGQFVDAMICYSFPPPGKNRGHIGIWDEFVCGTANKPGWLGKPEGAAVHLAASAPDCLGATGEALAKRIQGRVTKRATDAGVVIAANSQNDSETSFTIPGVPAEGGNLVVFLTMKAAASMGYPLELARFAEVGVGGDERSLLKRKPEQTGMAVRGKSEQPIAASSGARVNFGAATKIGDKLLPAYAVHPPFLNGKGYVFWCADIDVPANSELRFQLGMGEKSPQRSDGVWFSVHAAPLDGQAPGAFTKLFEESTQKHEWLPRSVPLAKYAAQRIRLKFVADCGPRDNAVTDHGYWGDVKIAPAGLTKDQATPPQERMTWMNDKPFTSTFYFRGLRSKTVDLTFRVEGREPVTIERVTAHAQPDAMVRVFEHGLVLANPSLAPVTFDLAKLTPGRSYRRIQATPQQDTQANNGAPVGDRVMLGPLEGLFLLRDNGDKHLP